MEPTRAGSSQRGSRTATFSGRDGAVYAFDRRSGTLRWRYELGYQVGSSPAVVPTWGLLFSSHERSPQGNGFVVALDARTRVEVWQPTEAHPHSSVAVDVAKAIVYAFDARTGHERWRHELDRSDGKADIKTTPTVIPARNLVVFGAWSGEVHALDETTGHVAWKHSTRGRLMSSTAYSPGSATVLVGSPNGRVFAIDAGSEATLSVESGSFGSGAEERFTGARGQSHLRDRRERRALGASTATPRSIAVGGAESQRDPE